MYSLNYKFEDLRVCYGRFPYGGIAYVNGSAEISFDRDRDWTIDSVTIGWADDPKKNIPIADDQFHPDAIPNELLQNHAGDISVAVTDFDIPPIAVEIAQVCYELGRGA